MRTNTQEAVLSAYIVSIGKRTPRDAAYDAAELCRLANSLSHLNEIACNFGLTERQARRKQNLQTRIKTVLAGTSCIIEKYNEWISLALIKLGIGRPEVVSVRATVENYALVPKTAD